MWLYDLDFPGQLWLEMYFLIVKSWTPIWGWWVWSLHHRDFNRKSLSLLTPFAGLPGLFSFPPSSKELVGFSQGGQWPEKLKTAVAQGYWGWTEIRGKWPVIAHWFTWLRIGNYFPWVVYIPFLVHALNMSLSMLLWSLQEHQSRKFK